MKKILFILSISLYANAISLEDNIGACNRGMIQACLDAGSEYQYIQEDNPKLFIYYKKACDLKDDYSCWKLGHSYREIGNDYRKARRAFLKSCDLGNLAGCIDGGRVNYANKLIYTSAQKLLKSKRIIKKINSYEETIFCTDDMKLCKTENEVNEFYYNNLIKDKK